jgi:hypothetical protein
LIKKRAESWRVTTRKEETMARREWLVGLGVVLCLLVSGCAGSSQYMVKAEPPVAGAPADRSVVYFMRPSGMGFAINFQIWDGDRFIGLSQAKSYFAYVCPPGKHLFIGIAENKVAVEADVAPGMSYYVITEPRIGGWKARLAMDPVTRGSEQWNNVETVKKELQFLAPVEEQIRAWDAEKRAEAAQLVEFFQKDPDRAKYMTRLRPEDGR